MPDFSVRFTAGDSSGLAWTDPATGSAPTRLNPLAAYPHRYSRVIAAATLKATVGGVEGPADAALAGRLFRWSWVERIQSGSWYSSTGVLLGATMPFPPLVTTPGSSSICTFDMASSPYNLKGYWAILCQREDGGGVVVPFVVF